ncbi:hypothetical protein CRG98_041736 [Punica granatum]|uniref:Uncharacterized protein n=1 Tax=Punica granatum TaxID=22663 RepID=A0A2I0I1N4_PUNGR|nr:hypothetical protein CRG98_041736 [Punica granatum]
MGFIEGDRRRPIEDDKRRWKSGMQTEIPEFHGSLKPEEFHDWLATVEEILEFKGVPEDKRVPLVAIGLRDRATTWWQQRLMYQRLQNLRQGTQMVDEYTIEFFQLIIWNEVHETEDQLVARYIGGLQRLMYQRLQNLRQGTQMVDEYTIEFFQLIIWNEVHETEDQLVARYIGGLQRLMYQRLQNLRQGTQMVDEYTIEFFQLIIWNEVHETEDQLVARYIGGLQYMRLKTNWWRGILEGCGYRFKTLSICLTHPVSRQYIKGLYKLRSSPDAITIWGIPLVWGAVVVRVVLEVVVVVGHRQSECRNTAGKKTFFVDKEEGEEEDVEEAEDLAFDSKEVVDEEVVTGDR